MESHRRDVLVLFLGTSIVVWILYGRVKGSIKRLELKGFDRQAGAMLGAVKGALLAMVITMFSVSLLGESARTAIHHSRIGPYVISGIGKISGVVPTEVAHFIQPHVDKFHEQLGHDGTQPIGVYPNAIALPRLPSINKYQIGGAKQNPNQLPAAQSGYQGQWQLQAPQPHTYAQQPNYSQQPNYRQPSGNQNGWNPGYNNQSAPTNTQGGAYYGNQYTNRTQPARNPTGQSPFNGASQELFNGVKQTIGDAVGEAAKRVLENGLPR